MRSGVTWPPEAFSRSASESSDVPTFSGRLASSSGDNVLRYSGSVHARITSTFEPALAWSPISGFPPEVVKHVSNTRSRRTKGSRAEEHGCRLRLSFTRASLFSARPPRVHWRTSLEGSRAAIVGWWWVDRKERHNRFRRLHAATIIPASRPPAQVNMVLNWSDEFEAARAGSK